MSEEERILMPKRLTVENGAKAMFRGEFYEIEWITCTECAGEGFPFEEDSDEECEICDGEGKLELKTQVSWTTIKAIYALAVEKFGVTTQTPRNARFEE